MEGTNRFVVNSDGEHWQRVASGTTLILATWHHVDTGKLLPMAPRAGVAPREG
jgi:hypothetical protein